jgi:predicted nuclease of predicted toxin-antitoxin system
MRILVDMNLTPRWVPFLNESGFDAEHWSTTGRLSATDSEICDHARQAGRMLLTNDLDFPQILAYTRMDGPSVIILRGEPLVPEVRGAALIRAIRQCEAELTKGAILSLSWTGRARIRLLPLEAASNQYTGNQ